jgi:membrane-bound serine protease (ClpP class)
MQVSSDAAFGAVSSGMFLIYTELCSPGLVLPGALGAVGVLGGGWVLWHKQIGVEGIILVAAALVFIAAAITLPVWRVFAVLALVCCCAGSMLLVRGPDPISPLLSVPLSIVWSAVTIALGRLAWKGHTNKRTQDAGRVFEIPESQAGSSTI